MSKSTKSGIIAGFIAAIAIAWATGRLPIFLSAFLFLLGSWQLDHFVAPFIWRHKGEKIEVLPILFLEVTQFYVICFICLTIGYIIAILGMVF